MKTRVLFFSLLGVSLLLAGCMQMMVLSRNQASLDIYGKVIDQNGEPVAGAKVQANVMLTVSMVETRDEIHFTETDANGRFKFLGLRGAELGIRPQKQGYEYKQKSTFSSRPSDYRPDPNNPVVFTMWKLKGAEPMTHANINAYIPCDGSVTRFNLLTGKTSADGDLAVKLTRNPVDIVRGKPFNWSVTLEIPSGGLQPMQDAYPNEAPVDGYKSSITFDFPTNMVHWTPYFDFKKFYFKGRNEQVYGSFSMDVTADFQPPPTSFSAEIYANPAGSRNLEFDRTKQIR
jgi:Carboxypeptidase regulatory-like domain